MKVKDIVRKSFDGTRFDICDPTNETLFLGTGLDIYKNRDLIIEPGINLWDAKVLRIECYYDDELKKSVIMLHV